MASPAAAPASKDPDESPVPAEFVSVSVLTVTEGIAPGEDVLATKIMVFPLVVVSTVEEGESRRMVDLYALAESDSKVLIDAVSSTELDLVSLDWMEVVSMLIGSVVVT